MRGVSRSSTLRIGHLCLSNRNILSASRNMPAANALTATLLVGITEGHRSPTLMIQRAFALAHRFYFYRNRGP